MEVLKQMNSHRLARLAEKAKGGDRAAASELYRELAPKVFGFCVTRLGNRGTAEDVTQDIFMKLAERIGQYDPTKGDFVAWFWQLARNTVIDVQRKRRETVFSDVATAADDPDDSSATDALGATDPRATADAEFSAHHIKAYVASLSDRERELFELRFVAELPYTEISRLMGTPEGALRVASARLRKKIAGHFTHYA